MAEQSTNWTIEDQQVAPHPIQKAPAWIAEQHREQPSASELNLPTAVADPIDGARICRESRGALDELGRNPELYFVDIDRSLRPAPVANRVQAWTVGARWALENGWGGPPGGPAWPA